MDLRDHEFVIDEEDPLNKPNGAYTLAEVMAALEHNSFFRKGIIFFGEVARAKLEFVYSTLQGELARAKELQERMANVTAQQMKAGLHAVKPEPEMAGVAGGTGSAD